MGGCGQDDPEFDEAGYQYRGLQEEPCEAKYVQSFDRAMCIRVL